MLHPKHMPIQLSSGPLLPHSHGFLAHCHQLSDLEDLLIISLPRYHLITAHPFVRTKVVFMAALSVWPSVSSLSPLTADRDSLPHSAVHCLTLGGTHASTNLSPCSVHISKLLFTVLLISCPAEPWHGFGTLLLISGYSFSTRDYLIEMY